jgi:hypothetical protein
MNRRFVAGAAFSVAVLMCVVASAQQGGQRGQRGQRGAPRGGGMQSMAQLVMNEAVREDVGVTSEQMTKLRELGTSLRGAGAGFNREELQNLSQEERREKMQEFAAQREKAAAEATKKLGEILDKKQLARLEQIQLQVAGVGMFRNPKVSEALKLTEDQQSQMQTAMRDLGQEMREAMSGGTPDAEKMAALRKKMMDKAMDVLSDDQKESLKKLTGKPFDVSKVQTRGFGRRGGGGDGGRRSG